MIGRTVTLYRHNPQIERKPGAAHAVGGMSDVTARILRYHEGRAPDLLERKYAAMAASPFAFYRGSCQLFADAWPARGALNDAPAIWSCGDLHFENLGCYKGDNRLVYFDLNDFDEAALLPVSWDVTRFAASVLVGASALRIGCRRRDDAREHLSRRVLRGRSRTARRAGSNAKRPPAWRARCSTPCASASARRCWTSAPMKEDGRRRIRVDGVKALAASRDERASVTRVVERLGTTLGRKKFYRVLDVARRIAGCGSLGLARFIVLVEGKGSPRGNFLLDLKEARTPASAGHSPYTPASLEVGCRTHRRGAEPRAGGESGVALATTAGWIGVRASRAAAAAGPHADGGMGWRHRKPSRRHDDHGERDGMGGAARFGASAIGDRRRPHRLRQGDRLAGAACCRWRDASRRVRCPSGASFAPTSRRGD